MPGGSSGSTTTVQKAEPWEEQKPYLIEAFQQAQGLYNAPGPSYYPGATVAPPSPESELALGARSARAMAGSPLNAMAAGQLYDTLGGQYLYGNPYFDRAIDAASEGVTRSYRNAVQPGIDSAFSAAGRYGSGLHQSAHADSQQALAERLADMAGTMAYRDYAGERANMMGATAYAPQLAQQDYADIGQLALAGNTRQGMQQDLINADIARFNYQQQLPYNKLAQYMALIEGDHGGTTTTSESRTGFSNLDFLTTGLGSLLGGLLSF